MICIANPIVRTRQKMTHIRRSVQQGFTLIELLVVIALTTILLTIVFKPLIDGLNLTARAGTQIESQAAARNVLHEVTALLSNASFVYDNAQTPINIWLTDKFKAPYVVPARFAMIEYVPPAHQLDQSPYLPGPPKKALPIDPTTGEPISSSSLSAGQGGFAMPLGPGRILGRIFVGLRNNLSELKIPGTNGSPITFYGNHFEDPSLGFAGDNRYTLYKAEVVAFIPDPDAADPSTAPYVPNLGLFHTVDQNGNVTDKKTDTLQVHDPNFFYDNSLAGGDGNIKWAVPGWRDLNGDGKVEIWENWQAVSASIMPLNKADLIALDRDPDNNQILYDPNTNRPTLRMLVSFAPAFVQNDPGVPTNLENSGNEAPNVASPSYAAQYTHWATPYRLFVYRAANGGDPLQQSPLDYFESTGDGRIVHVDPGMNIKPGDTPPDPAGLTDIGPMIDSNSGVFLNNDPQFAYLSDVKRGIVNFAFSSGAVVYAINNGPGPKYKPLPQFYYTNPLIDPNVNINIAPPRYPGAPPFRYLDLRTLPALSNPSVAPGIKSPLDPTRAWSNKPGYAVHILPGSERVIGPDQRPGPHYGTWIQYTRVSALTGITGPNEYIINYDDISNGQNPNDPGQRVGYIQFDSLSAGDTFDLPDDPKNGIFPQHHLPIWKLSNGANVVADPIAVTYKFQVNQPNDVVKVDYLTRELINFSLEAKLYDPPSSRPQVTSVTDKIKVRNLQH
jgi:prepilin-type N-terminal cleavage/methylation domain-containing protein